MSDDTANLRICQIMSLTYHVSYSNHAPAVKWAGIITHFTCAVLEQLGNLQQLCLSCITYGCAHYLEDLSALLGLTWACSQSEVA